MDTVVLLQVDPDRMLTAEVAQMNPGLNRLFGISLPWKCSEIVVDCRLSMIVVLHWMSLLYILVCRWWCVSFLVFPVWVVTASF